MYTANTMASAIEALGFSLPYNASNPAVGNAKVAECTKAGEAVMELLKKDLKTFQYHFKKSFENAITLVIALGGSTNAVLHFLAIADAAGYRF